MTARTNKLSTPNRASAENYNATLEAFYNDLLLKEKAGAVPASTHRALEVFLDELRELVTETNARKMRQAA